MSAFFEVDEFCQAYRLSRPTLYRLVARGEIRLVKIGRASRIRREDAERWAASLRVA